MRERERGEGGLIIGLSKEAGSGPKAERDGEGGERPQGHRVRDVESDGKRRWGKKTDEDSRRIIIHRQEANVAMGRGGRPTDYGGGRRCSGGMIQPDRAREKRRTKER